VNYFKKLLRNWLLTGDEGKILGALQSDYQRLEKLFDLRSLGRSSAVLLRRAVHCNRCAGAALDRLELNQDSTDVKMRRPTSEVLNEIVDTDVALSRIVVNFIELDPNLKHQLSPDRFIERTPSMAAWGRRQYDTIPSLNSN
jgi:hypothetical protein